MPNLLIPGVTGDPLLAASYNSNLDAIETSLFDLGPYVLSGLILSAGTGLSVNVTSGTATIGGRITKGSSFSISGLAPSTINHIYLQQNGTGTSNTTGTAPALSVKLGTALTDASSVTSVDNTRVSGRQTKVPLDTVVAANEANSFTLQNTFTLNDAVAGASYPLQVRHSNSGGVGAANLAVGIDLHLETATEGDIRSFASVEAVGLTMTAGSQTGRLDLRVRDAGTAVTPLMVETKKISIPQAVNASANHGLLSIGSAGFAGGGGTNFAGLAAGTSIAVNMPGSFAGNLIDAQLAGVSSFKVSAAGNITTTGSLSTGGDLTVLLLDTTSTGTSYPLIVRHGHSAGVGGAGIGSGIRLQIETGTEGTYNTVAEFSAGASTVTAGSVTSSLDLKVSQAGTMVIPISFANKQVTLGQAVAANAQAGYLSLGDGGFAGGANHFAGHSSGTAIAANLASGYAGNLIDLQVAGVQTFVVTGAGNVTLKDAANVAVGTTTGTKIGTTTSQKIAFWNATPVVRPAAYTPTNVTTDRSWDCNATTLDEVADVLATLVQDLQSIGLLG